MFVVDTFFDVTSINDVPLSLVERIEDRLEQLLNRSKVDTMNNITNDKAKHQYIVDALNLNNQRETIQVDANTRTQAAKIVTTLGYTMQSINMIG